LHSPRIFNPLGARDPVHFSASGRLRINLGGLVWTATVIYCRFHGGFEQQA
jgi:hypothetical protein